MLDGVQVRRVRRPGKQDELRMISKPRSSGTGRVDSCIVLGEMEVVSLPNQCIDVGEHHLLQDLAVPRRVHPWWGFCQGNGPARPNAAPKSSSYVAT